MAPTGKLESISFACNSNSAKPCGITLNLSFKEESSCSNSRDGARWLSYSDKSSLMFKTSGKDSLLQKSIFGSTKKLISYRSTCPESFPIGKKFKEKITGYLFPSFEHK